MTAWCARAAATVLLFVAAGCGEDSARNDSTAGPSIRQVPSPTDTTPIKLDEPGSKTVLRGRGVQGEPVALTLRVTGTSAPDETLLVKAACPQRSCQQFVLADEGGAFTTELRFRLRGSPTRIAITADYATHPSPATAAQTQVRVRIKRRPAPKPPSIDDDTTDPATVPELPPQSTAPSTTSSGPSTARRRLTVIGDSLAIGMRPYLAGNLPGWQVTIDGRIGRPLAEGMTILANTTIPASGTVLALSLFTNDDPRNTDALSSAISRALKTAGPDGCVVWATIARPPLNGVGYGAANRVIQAAGAANPRMRIVGWAAYANEHPELLADDGVHLSTTGYQQLAAMYAQAASSCP